MSLTKVKGIVIKEIPYKENDKILTILTDKLGRISCISRGCKRVNNALLASSQYLVFSEFILYKGTKYYTVNSANVINTFYNLRIDFDKLSVIFNLTKLLYKVTDENQDTEYILKLFLNTIYLIDRKENKNINLICSVFKIKLLALLGFMPKIDKCAGCENKLFEDEKEQYIMYDYVANEFFCTNCKNLVSSKRCIELKKATVIAIRYIIFTSLNKVFSFELKEVSNLKLFADIYEDAITNGI